MLTSEEIRNLKREILSSTNRNQLRSPLESNDISISSNEENLSIETEYQMLLLIDRLSEIRGIGEVRATKVVELLIRNGLSDISHSDLEELNWNDDTTEKVWLYLLGLRDSVNDEFNTN